LLTTIIVASSFVSVPVGETAYGYIENNPLKAETALAAALEESTEPQDVESLVRTYFKDIPVMVSIARCESTFTHTLADGSVLKGKVDSADTGVMQINRRFHEARAAQLGYNLTLLEDNLAYARMLYEEQGTKPWNASAPCWQKTLAKAQ
jgi:hypothetical protein